MRQIPTLLLLALLGGLLMAREVNASALAIANAAEGCVLTGYRDPAGIATAGYGHTGPDVVVGKTYSQAQADAWRQQDMARAAAFVAAHVRVELNPNQFSALAEFTYNVGVGNFLGSTLLRRLNRGNYNAVPAQLARWNKVKGKILPGLVVRRAQEAALFATPVSPVPCTATPTPPTVLERLRAWFAHTVFA
jgi:lysozyme